ncbi:MAG TPA: alpha-1,2-fucosyltransferase [Gaiellaceae bacterium]|nr:alpha-1,2-fucosyltransferase [Gaiellaceae bacterium]
MVVVRLTGGLGNQLFQYAAARRLSLVRGTELVLDTGWFRHEAAGYPAARPYELRHLELPARVVSLSPQTIARWEQGLTARVGRWPGRRIRLPVIRQSEDWSGLDERVLDGPADVVLDGYWQNEGYFRDVAETLRAELRLPAAPGPRFAQLLEAIASSEAIAVHLRRGDYVTVPQVAEVHGTLELAYYREAVGLVAERAGSDAHVFVFSDDPEWAEAHLVFDLPTTHVGRTGSSATAELRLMASCRHHVVANSSYSWWGAWLAERPGQVVVAPTRWTRRTDSSAIVPARWMRI